MSNLPAGAEYDPRAPWNEKPTSNRYIVMLQVSKEVENSNDIDWDIEEIESDLRMLGFTVDKVDYYEE